MLKTIPKSNITKRSFNVYKEWTIDNGTYPLESASLSINKSKYKSILAKYYRDDANVFNLYGSTSNVANISSERAKSDLFQIISLPQEKYGEKIKPGSIEFTDLDNEVTFVDNSKSTLTSTSPLYTITSLDLNTSTIVIVDNDGETFTLTIGDLDLSTGATLLIYGTETDSIIFGVIDFQNSTLTTTTDIEVGGLSIDKVAYGNVFYSDGLFVFTQNGSLGDNYTLKYKSTKTIHETEILVSAGEGQFNYSQNPSAVDVTLSGSYDFTTTAINNVKPAGTIKIKEVRDISRKSLYHGTATGSLTNIQAPIGELGTGSWDDYYESSSVDPTGSYLAPFVTTIGLYDDDNNMIAIAKLPKPIKKLPDYDVNFIVRFDT